MTPLVNDVTSCVDVKFRRGESSSETVFDESSFLTIIADVINGSFPFDMEQARNDSKYFWAILVNEKEKMSKYP